MEDANAPQTTAEEEAAIAAIVDAEPQTDPTASPVEDAGGESFLEELAALEAELEGEPFEDLRDLLDTDHAETLGLTFDWPAMPGAKVTIAHMSAAVAKKTQLETKYRSKHRKLPQDSLPSNVEERLWHEAMYGTVVKGWSGLKLDGKPFGFTLDNYRTLMKIRRFRAFVIEKSRDADAFRSRADEEIRGN